MADTIEDEITRIETAKTTAANNVTAMGGTVPSGAKLGAIADSILTIPVSKIIVLEDNGTTTAGTWLAKTDKITAYEDGQLFWYKITIAGASTTTLNINGLGAKTVYIYNTTKLGTHYRVGNHILLSYDTQNDCFRVTNNYWETDTISLQSSYIGTLVGSTAIVANSIIGYGADNKIVNIISTNAKAPFNWTLPVYWCSTARAAGYDASSGTPGWFTMRSNSTIVAGACNATAWAKGDPVLVKGTINGAMFTIDTTTNNGVVLDYPSTNDGYYYFFIGFGRAAYASTATKYLTINQTHPIFYYNNGLKVFAPKDLTSSDITTALGYTPYSAANPSGYTSNTGTVTSVRVQAGTGLTSSQSTAQTGTLNTTISIASGYKLPTTTEWNSKASTSAVEAKQDQITVESGGSYQTISYTPAADGVPPSEGGSSYGTVYILLEDTYSKVQFVGMSAGGGDQYEAFRNSDSSPVILTQGSSVTLQDQEGYSGGSSCTFTLNGSAIETSFYTNDINGISMSDLKGFVAVTTNIPTTVDTAPTQNSTHLITSGAVYDAVNSGNYVTLNTAQTITAKKTFTISSGHAIQINNTGTNTDYSGHITNNRIWFINDSNNFLVDVQNLGQSNTYTGLSVRDSAGQQNGTRYTYGKIIQRTNATDYTLTLPTKTGTLATLDDVQAAITTALSTEV